MGGTIFDKWVVGNLGLLSARLSCQNQGYNFAILETQAGSPTRYHVQCYWIG